MKLTLPKDVLESLPSPDSEGLVRVQASIKLGENGTAELVEVNDSPVPMGDEAESDDAQPMPPHEIPDLGAVESDIYT